MWGFFRLKTDILNFDTLKLNFSKMTENVEDTLVEINDDIGQFLNYMKNSIYYASELESIFKQELDKIALKFEIRKRKTYVIR